MRAVLYARVSTARQAEQDLSIPYQLGEMQSYCERKGITVVEGFIEPGASGRDENRPEFQRMVRYVLDRDHDVDLVVVYSFSRFFRDHVQSELYKRRLRKHDVDVVAITQETTDNASGRMVEGLFGLLDQMESEIIGERTIGGMMENAKRGYFNGSTAPFGYEVKEIVVEGKTRRVLAVNEEEAATVRWVFDLYVNGDSGRRVGIKRIVEMLNAEDRLWRGKQWTKQRLQERLADPLYIGEYFFNKKHGKTGREKPRSEWVQIDVRSIIDREVFEAASNLRYQHKPTTTNPAVVSSPLLLTGVLYCGKCGAPMQLDASKNRKGTWYRYYNCSAFLRRGKTACPGNRLPMSQLERAVLAHLSDGLFTPERIKTLIVRLYDNLKKQSANPQEVAQVKGELERVRKSIDKYYLAFEADEITAPQLNERLTKLNNERETLETRLQSMTAYNQVPPYIHTQRFQASFRQQLAEVLADTELARRYLGLFVKRIVASGREITVESAPEAVAQMAVSADEEGKIGVMPAVLNWLPYVDVDLNQAETPEISHLSLPRAKKRGDSSGIDLHNLPRAGQGYP